MTTTRKWNPLHYRNGCWVESYHRSNGSVVKRHYRAGGAVKGHFAAVNPGSELNTLPTDTTAVRGQPAPRRTPPPQIAIHLSRNTATLAYCISQYGIGRPIRHTPRKNTAPTAYIYAVTYVDDRGHAHIVDSITAATNSINVPTICRQITLHVTLHQHDAPHSEYRLDTGFFFNADGTIATLHDANADPEVANHFLERFTPDIQDDAARIRRRNQMRQLTGAQNPDKAIFQAANDLLAASPLPALTPTRDITITVPGADYTIVIHPNTHQP